MFYHNYPVQYAVQGVKRLVLSVCLSVCLCSHMFTIYMYTGYYKISVLALVVVIIVIIVVWIDQSKKLALITEQEIEMKLRRKKTVQVSETAEWVNLAINRW